MCWFPTFTNLKELESIAQRKKLYGDYEKNNPKEYFIAKYWSNIDYIQCYVTCMTYTLKSFVFQHQHLKIDAF